jgi:hypothetical protein
MTTDDTFVFDNITIENVGGNGIFTGDDGTTSSANITVKNSNFKNNGLTSSSNPADLEIFRFEGTILIENITIEKANQDDLAINDNAYGIEFRGDTCNGSTDSVATAILKNVTISGTPNKEGMLIQCYSDVSGFSFVDVDLSNVTTDINAFWPTSLVVSHTGTKSLDVSNLKTQEIIAANSGNINATKTKFFDSNLNLVTDNFDIEDRIGHALDADNLGLVTWNAGNLYVTEKSGSIQRGVDNAGSSYTVNVDTGLYEIDFTITIDKPLTLLGPQANVDPRTAAALRTAGDASEAIIDGGNTVGELIQVDADNVTINGFEIKSGTGDLVTSSSSTVQQNPKVIYNLIHDSTLDEGIQLKQTESSIIKLNHIFDVAGDGINLAWSHNGLIDSNEVHNSNSTNAGIYLYNDAQDGESPPAFTDFINATIQNNLVYDITQNDGIKLGDKNGLDENIKGGSILNNIIHDTEQDGITVYSSNVTIEGNEIFKSKSENGALYVAHNVADITIKDNNIHDNKVNPDKDKGPTYGIRIGGFGNNYAIFNVSVDQNVIAKNKKGMIYESSGNATIDVKNNYWGSKKGPEHSTNTGGNGDEISGTNITFTPFYIDAGVAILNDEVSTAPGEEKTIKPTKDKVTLDDGDDSQKIKGQAALPEDIVEIIFKNNAVLDVNDNIGGKVGNNIEVGGISIGLATFEIQLDDDDGSMDSVPTDLTVAKKVATVDVIIEKAVKLKSGTIAEPIIIKNVDIPTVIVSIPDETTILAPAGWTGTIQPPKAASNSGTAPSGFSVGDTVIEVGSPDAVLLFDTPVTLTLEGVTGAVGYKPAGSTVWTQITEQCGGSFDNPDAPSFFPGECFISDGSNTKIVTYHFTSFGSLGSLGSAPSTPAKSSSSGSGRTNVSPEEIAKKSSTSMSRVSDWVSLKDYFKIGVRDLISRGYIENVNTIPSQSPPDWFYSTGQAWKDGKITNEEYFDAVKYLINHKILK